MTLSQSVPDVDHVLSGATVAALRHGGVGGVGDAVEEQCADLVRKMDD